MFRHSYVLSGNWFLISPVKHCTHNCIIAVIEDEFRNERLFLSFLLNSWHDCIHFYFYRIVHVIITLIFNFTILRDIEKMAGWARIAVIYLASGMGGNLWSSVLTPYQVEVRKTHSIPRSIILLSIFIKCQMYSLSSKYVNVKRGKVAELVYLNMVILGCH